MGEYLNRGADISECGTYRYSLRRVWDTDLPRLGVMMLNPSTADWKQDDPTIRKVVEFAKRLGYGSIEVCNLFAFRATDPRKLWAFLSEKGIAAACGEGNDEAIREMEGRCAAVLNAWGAGDSKGYVNGRVQWLMRKVFNERTPHFSLGYTKFSNPRHPLYVPYSAIETARVIFATPQPLDGGEQP